LATTTADSTQDARGLTLTQEDQRQDQGPGPLYRSFSSLDVAVDRSCHPLSFWSSSASSASPGLLGASPGDAKSASDGAPVKIWTSGETVVCDDDDHTSRVMKDLAAAAPRFWVDQGRDFADAHPTVVVPIEPAYVEHWSSMFTVSANILDRVAAILGNTPNAVFRHVTAKSQLKGTFTASGQTVKFAIYLYRAPTLGYTVEVVRRAGDCLLFNSLYAGLRHELGNAVAPRQATPSFEDDLVATLPPLDQILSF